MKAMKLVALVLVLALVLPFAVSCGNAQSGTPNSFPNVLILTTYDPASASSAPEEVTDTADEPAEPVEDGDDYEETVYSGEIVVYTQEEGQEITVLDLLRAYENAKNVAVVYDSANNRVTKIGEISAGGGYFWNYVINGKDAGLSDVITPEDDIQIIFTK